MVKRLILPGLGGSGKRHWQSWWLAQDPEAELVHQDDWDHPDLRLWLYRLAVKVRQHPGAILVGHSLGALLVPHLVQKYKRLQIGGALMVAPPDVETVQHLRQAAVSFAPIPRLRLPFPSIVVTSSNDRLMPSDQARRLAASWGSRFFDIGPAGHINVASGYGSWFLGLRLAEQLAQAPEGDSEWLVPTAPVQPAAQPAGNWFLL